MRDPSQVYALCYDADCAFCRWMAGLLVTYEGRCRLRPVGIQSPEGARLLGPLPRDQRQASWHLVTPDGTVLSAGAAVPDLLRLLPFGVPAAAAAEAMPETTQFLYTLLVRGRPMLGRLFHLHACPVS